MIRLVLGTYDVYEKKGDAPEWTEVLPDGANEQDVVKFVEGMVEGFNAIQNGNWEPIPVFVRLIQSSGNSETVISETVMT